MYLEPGLVGGGKGVRQHFLEGGGVHRSFLLLPYLCLWVCMGAMGVGG